MLECWPMHRALNTTVHDPGTVVRTNNPSTREVQAGSHFKVTCSYAKSFRPTQVTWDPVLGGKTEGKKEGGEGEWKGGRSGRTKEGKKKELESNLFPIIKTRTVYSLTHTLSEMKTLSRRKPLAEWSNLLSWTSLFHMIFQTTHTDPRMKLYCPGR